ncbi:MalY/PatB family protein [Paraclostridium bifermentans]|uniref:MalY/PatB family protein n=1 Tax=Paraclostridium bifermentans TaxID=1490 RepID=UPI00359C5DB4
MYNFEDILYRNENGSKKWNIDYIDKRFPKHKSIYYPLFIADMDYKLPEEITSKFTEYIQTGDFGYFDVLEKFNNSISRWYKRVNNIHIDKKWIIPGIGTLASMNIALKATIKKNSNVLIFTPVYGPFKDIVINNKFNLTTQKLYKKKNRYYIDFDLLEKNIAKNEIKCILMCNPHNPSGRVWSFEELNELVKICKKYDVTLISDEVHSDLVLDKGKFTSMAQFFNTYKNIIISSSPNKTFNLAGISSSYIITSDNSIYENIESEFKKNKLGINRVGYEFSTICYNYGQDWVEELTLNIKSNIKLVKELLDLDGINVMEPEAGYLLWIKLDKVTNTLDFVEKLAQKTGVLVESGTRFVDGEDGYIRLNVATSKNILLKSMKELVNFYRAFNEV